MAERKSDWSSLDKDHIPIITELNLNTIPLTAQLLLVIY